MADEQFNSEDVVKAFRKPLDVHKFNIRIIVLDELISECYGPQALLEGKKIRDIVDLKFWLEKKLQDSRERQAAKEGTPKTTLAPPMTNEMLKREWEAKRKAAKAAAA